MPHELGSRLVAAVASQNQSALAECFATDVEFRALTPPGLRERSGAGGAAWLVSQWFGDSTELHLVDSHSNEVGDRLHVSYRFAGVEEGKEYVVEQHLVCTIADDKIVRADLLCTGFRPPRVTD